MAEKPSASNLWGFGSAIGSAGFSIQNKIAGPHYFGNTAFKDGDMVKWVKDKSATNSAN